jgi:hypothetical protein
MKARLFCLKHKKMNSTYFDDLEIENYFDFDTAPSMPTTPGFLGTNPQEVLIDTAPRMNADGKLRDKLKKFAQSNAGKKILKIGGIAAGAGVLVAFGPQIIAALAPVLPAMKTALAKKGVKAKGLGDVIKKFSQTQLSLSDDDKKDPKKIVLGILQFFKAAKDRRAAGTASPLDNLILQEADETIQKIADGTLSVEEVTSDAANDTAKVTKQLTTDAATTTTTETKKTGIDFKIVLIVLVAVFFLTKK